MNGDCFSTCKCALTTSAFEWLEQFASSSKWFVLFNTEYSYFNVSILLIDLHVYRPVHTNVHLLVLLLGTHMQAKNCSMYAGSVHGNRTVCSIPCTQCWWVEIALRVNNPTHGSQHIFCFSDWHQCLDFRLQCGNRLHLLHVAREYQDASSFYTPLSIPIYMIQLIVV